MDVSEGIRFGTQHQGGCDHQQCTAQQNRAGMEDPEGFLNHHLCGDPANGDQHQYQQHQKAEGEGLIRKGDQPEQSKASKAHGQRCKYFAQNLYKGEGQHFPSGFGPTDLIEHSGKHQQDRTGQTIDQGDEQMNIILCVQRVDGKQAYQWNQPNQPLGRIQRGGKTDHEALDYFGKTHPDHQGGTVHSCIQEKCAEALTGHQAGEHRHAVKQQQNQAECGK